MCGSSAAAAAPGGATQEQKDAYAARMNGTQGPQGQPAPEGFLYKNVQVGGISPQEEAMSRMMRTPLADQPWAQPRYQSMLVADPNWKPKPVSKPDDTTATPVAPTTGKNAYSSLIKMAAGSDTGAIARSNSAAQSRILLA